MKKYFSYGSLQALFLISVTLIMGASFFFLEYLGPQLTTGEYSEIFIAPGYSARSIGRLLSEEGVIKDETVFLMVLRLWDRANHLRAGQYYFTSQDNVFDIIEKLHKGQVQTYRVTIPEGLSIEEIARLMEARGHLDKEDFLQVAQDVSHASAYLPNPHSSITYPLEGYLFPATYTFPVGASPEHVIKVMVQRFEEEIQGEWEDRAIASGFTVHEMITLASIIETETQLDEERPLVSAVMHNRLDIGMYLQSCATVQYALPERKSRLLYKDLEIDSPYNTYLHGGLPPGPIASPGSASLQAAVRPADVEYLFFVARPDGSHKFSKTYEEHLMWSNER